jgi:hypothetical protein
MIFFRNLILLILISGRVFALEHDMDMSHKNLKFNIMRVTDCSAMEVFDIAMQMCMPLPIKDMPMTMLMFHENSFLTGIIQNGPRGRNAFALPDMFMADFGTTLSDHHYLNLDFMGTVERWTFPTAGYPLFLQIGEDNASGNPYVDAQHPHSSPIMGLTLSDTIGFENGKDHIKIFVAPRGESTDGPIAFMHRPTGIANPDVPLGHHIGQDVGHISSSVIGESLKLGTTRIEASNFYGAEPKPTNVDLPTGTPNSYSFRIMEEISPSFLAMASYAYINNPEPDSPDITSENRYSASLYNFFSLSPTWSFDNTFIYGGVSNYDHAATLTSFAEEFLFMGEHPRIWGRIEVLQRTPAELQITTASDANGGQWVEELTLGYTHKISSCESAELGLGGSVSTDFLPTSYQSAYGGNSWTGKIFLQLSGTKMWDLN